MTGDGLMKPTLEEWRKVVRAIEESLPVYDSVSEKISLNLARKARGQAIAHLAPYKRDWIIDIGVGPGTSSRMLLANGFKSIVGLDPSIVLLKHVKQTFHNGFHPVRGVSEWIPFREHSFGGVLICFALRDVRDLRDSLKEISRVTQEHGRFGLVDIGKPENAILRGFIGFYVKHGMPIVSSLATKRRVPGNPFLMIVPTFNRLVSNQVLVKAVRNVFAQVGLRSIMLGGLIVILAEKSQPAN
jgi:demethylmenaquinone methyltransferase/2-methoxy-6-polyprenyl-1,4-benzoquinol methylase